MYVNHFSLEVVEQKSLILEEIRLLLASSFLPPYVGSALFEQVSDLVEEAFAELVEGARF